MKVVLDTNILISAIIFGGKPRAILELIRSKELDLVLSKEILEEFAGVLVDKFNYDEDNAKLVVNSLMEISQIVEPTERIEAIKDDPDDNMILEAALEGKVNYVISGDNHLLKLKEYQSIAITTAHNFLEI